MRPLSSLLRANLHRLGCPGCSTPIIEEDGGLRCANGECAAFFPVHENGIVDMIPQILPAWRPSPEEHALSAVELAYRKLCFDPSCPTVEATPWGDLADAPSGYRRFVRSHCYLLGQLLASSHCKGCIVDISGGSGAYLRAVARNYQCAIHLEAHVPSLLAAREWARKEHLDQILFIRGSYLKPPLREGTADALLCTDTLIRTRQHNRRLLSSVRYCISTRGIGIIDAHARTALRGRRSSCLAVPLAISEFRRVLSAQGLCCEGIYGSGYSPSTFTSPEWQLSALAFFARLFRQPSRWVAVVRKGANADNESTRPGTDSYGPRLNGDEWVE
jgi:hypothetical protein